MAADVQIQNADHATLLRVGNAVYMDLFTEVQELRAQLPYAMLMEGLEHEMGDMNKSLTSLVAYFSAQGHNIQGISERHRPAAATSPAAPPPAPALRAGKGGPLPRCPSPHVYGHPIHPTVNHNR